ncbi:MAG: MFS transporter [Cyclobacteriaceae bacterium]
MKTLKNFRWWIAGLLALATALNYLDRQSLPVAITEIEKSIPISDLDYSHLQMLFLISYSLMYVIGGKLVDVLGSRVGYLIIICWWSLANCLHGLVNSVTGLGIGRFLLGLGEGGGFPASAKVVSEWFPAKERSLAFGIFNTGSSLGAVIAPPLIAVIILGLSWRWVFFITGGLGFVWALVWYKVYRKPAENKLLSSEERAYIDTGLKETSPKQTTKIPWVDLFKYKKVWGLLIAKFLSDAAWYFYIFWLPKYLGDIRGLDIKEIGYYAWIPYAAAGAGSFIAGWLSSYLIKKNFTLGRSRKIALGLSAALMPASLLIADAPLSFAIVFFCMAMFGHQAFSTLMQTLTADLFPSTVVGSVAGLVGAAGSLGGVAFNFIVGLLLTHFSYSPVFVIAGILHPIAFLFIVFMIRKVKMETM